MSKVTTAVQTGQLSLDVLNNEPLLKQLIEHKLSVINRGGYLQLIPSDQPIIQKEVIQNGNGLDVEKYQQASLLVLKQSEEKILDTKVDEDDIEIRPDGLIYYPQVFAREILNKAFGVGQWVLIEHQVKLDTEHNKMYLEGSLYIRGYFVAKAWGEQAYYPLKSDGKPNPMFSFGSVHESAKSDCIVRCCKDLGIGKELWQPKYVREWIKKFAVKVWRNKKQSYEWRRKDSDPFYDEGKVPDKTPPTTTQKTESKTDTKKKPEPEVKPSKKEVDEARDKIEKAVNIFDLQSIYVGLSKALRAEHKKLIENYSRMHYGNLIGRPLKEIDPRLNDANGLIKALMIIKSEADYKKFCSYNMPLIAGVESDKKVKDAFAKKQAEWKGRLI